MTYSKKVNTIIKEIKESIRDDTNKISPKRKLQIALLKDMLQMYLTSLKQVENEGYLMTFNNGKTNGANPLVKVRLDTAKICLKILKEIYDKVEDEEDDVDDFINHLISGK